jgi:hypothetical protein
MGKRNGGKNRGKKTGAGPAIPPKDAPSAAASPVQDQRRRSGGHIHEYDFNRSRRNPSHSLILADTSIQNFMANSTATIFGAFQAADASSANATPTMGEPIPGQPIPSRPKAKESTSHVASGGKTHGRASYSSQTATQGNRQQLPIAMSSSYPAYSGNEDDSLILQDIGPQYPIIAPWHWHVANQGYEESQPQTLPDLGQHRVTPPTRQAIKTPVQTRILPVMVGSDPHTPSDQLIESGSSSPECATVYEDSDDMEIVRVHRDEDVFGKEAEDKIQEHSEDESEEYYGEDSEDAIEESSKDESEKQSGDDTSELDQIREQYQQEKAAVEQAGREAMELFQTAFDDAIGLTRKTGFKSGYKSIFDIPVSADSMPSKLDRPKPKPKIQEFRSQLDDISLQPAPIPYEIDNDDELLEVFMSRLANTLNQMMYVSGETAEPPSETTAIIEEIVRAQVIEIV